MASVITSRVSIAWHSPKLFRRSTAYMGDALFCIYPMAKDELLVTWGGVIVTTDELATLPEFSQHRSVQVEEHLHLTSGQINDSADCVNHSCNPSAGLRGQISLVAMRDLLPGDEVTFDYAMTDTYSGFCMPCACGEANCRHLVTGDDWQLPELQARYKGYFSPYIERLIARQRRLKGRR